MYDWAEFRHFKYLLTILELQGFRAAAEQLNTGQPNLSIQAKRFQEYASLRLYEKAKDGRIKPTDTGVAFQFIAKSVLEARDEAFEALAALALSSVQHHPFLFVDVSFRRAVRIWTGFWSFRPARFRLRSMARANRCSGS